MSESYLLSPGLSYAAKTKPGADTLTNKIGTQFSLNKRAGRRFYFYTQATENVGGRRNFVRVAETS